MKSITIKGKKRESVGKNATRALRNADQVPCVIYGGDQPVHFSTDEKSFKNLVYTPEANTVAIDLGGKKIEGILQDVQFHPVTDKILHADFYQLFEDKEVTMSIPVRLTGRSKGVVSGGSLQFNMRKLTVRALPGLLPDEIVIDITPLKIGGKIYVDSLRSDDYKLMHPDNAVVVAVKMSRAAMKGGSVDDDDEEETEGEGSEGNSEEASE